MILDWLENVWLAFMAILVFSLLVAAILFGAWLVWVTQYHHGWFLAISVAAVWLSFLFGTWACLEDNF